MKGGSTNSLNLDEYKNLFELESKIKRLGKKINKTHRNIRLEREYEDEIACSEPVLLRYRGCNFRFRWLGVFSS